MGHIKTLNLLSNSPEFLCFISFILVSISLGWLCSSISYSSWSSFFFAIASGVSQPSIQAYGNYEVFNEITVVENTNGIKKEDKSTLKNVENGLLVITEKNFPHVFEQRLSKTDISIPQLLLLGVYSGPSIPYRSNIIKKLENTASLVTRHSYQSMESLGSGPRPLLPIIGKINISNVSNDWIRHYNFSLGGRLLCPSLSFVLEGLYSINNDITDSCTFKNNGVKYNIYNYLGKFSTSEEIHATIMHRWYRLVISQYFLYTHHTFVETTNLLKNSSLLMNPTDNKLGKITKKVNDNSNEEELYHLVNNNIDTTNILSTIPFPPVFVFPTLDMVTEFINIHGKEMFYHITQDFSAKSASEETYIRSLIDIYQNDPFYIFLQCRRDLQHGENRDQVILNLFKEYQKLAELYIARGDIAFFVISSGTDDDCKWISNEWYDYNDSLEEVDIDYDGAVRVMKIYPDNREKMKLSQKGRGINKEKWIDESIYYVHLLNKNISSNEDWYDLTKFVLIQSTPSIMWYDRLTSSSLAFPIYRKVHVVLFVDMHTIDVTRSPTNPYNIDVWAKSRYAISLLWNAVIHHERTLHSKDVVFLIVPSTEIRIMNTFGIDIWTHLDVLCTKKNRRTQGCTVNVSMLPTLLITSRESFGGMMKRYYLSSESMLDNSTSFHLNWTTSCPEPGPIASFLVDMFRGNLSPHIRSQSAPSKEELTNDSGVQIITGNTFHELVMNRNHKHSLVQFYSPSCGHCKRFSIMWNQLSALIRLLNWNSVIDILKMDLTKNDVIHNGVDVRSFPSVYYFPAGSKDDAIPLKMEMDIELGESNLGGLENVTSILQWIISMNKVNISKLLKLAESDII